MNKKPNSVNLNRADQPGRLFRVARLASSLQIQSHPHLLNSCVLAFQIFFFGLALSACDTKPDEPKAPHDVVHVETEPETVLDQQAADAWWQTGGATIASCLQASIKLQIEISAFLDSPSEEGLKETQLRWQETKNAWRAFYAHRQLALSEAKVFQELNEINFRIAAWPVQPGSLDSFGSYLYSGLVHDIGNPLTMENLVLLHGQIDSENATLGIFAIEYMLYGENGSRTFDDYTRQNEVGPEYKERGFQAPSELPNNRRRLLLEMQAKKLLEDLGFLSNNWQSNETNSSQSTHWNMLENTQKNKALTTAFENGMAQLLVNSSRTRNIHTLLVSLVALRPLPALIQHKNSQAIESAISNLESSLQANSSKTDTKPTADESWQKIVTQLTDISKLFSAPSAEMMPQTESADNPDAS